jgi:hypothetical protein
MTTGIGITGIEVMATEAATGTEATGMATASMGIGRNLSSWSSKKATASVADRR